MIFLFHNYLFEIYILNNVPSLQYGMILLRFKAKKKTYYQGKNI